MENTRNVYIGVVLYIPYDTLGNIGHYRAFAHLIP